MEKLVCGAARGCCRRAEPPQLGCTTLSITAPSQCYRTHKKEPEKGKWQRRSANKKADHFRPSVRPVCYDDVTVYSVFVFSLPSPQPPAVPTVWFVD